MKKIGKWIPVSSGRFPENNSVVQVTYVDPLDQQPYDAMLLLFTQKELGIKLSTTVI